MHVGMRLEEMLSEVVRHSKNKRDFVADTREHIAMVPMDAYPKGVALVLSKEDSAVLERFEITENCHSQIAARLKIPQKFYDRLLEDHRDLVLENVNQLFKREPALRMVRTLDNKARAFLSNSFRRVDNEQILEQTLPVIRHDFDTRVLNSYVDEDRMRIKCLFTGDDHEVSLGNTQDGQNDIVHAGFEMGNSETGKGTFFIRGFFYRSYCDNGCVFGSHEGVDFRQVHVGSRLGVTKTMLLSNETLKKEDELIVSAAKDVLRMLSSPEFTQELGDKLRSLRHTESVRDPFASVEAVCKELRLPEHESTSVLESFIKDRDYTQWGMVNAVTSVANKTETYPRACKLEEAGQKVIDLNTSQWRRIAKLERVAA